MMMRDNFHRQAVQSQREMGLPRDIIMPEPEPPPIDIAPKDDPVDIIVTDQNRGFMSGVEETIVQQDDFRGIGGHGLEESHQRDDHEDHSQISIGLGNRTVNFRDIGH